MATMKGKVQTVLGAVSPECLGHVLPHEHFEIDVEKTFFKNPLVDKSLENAEFSLPNIGWIRQFPYSHRSNMRVEGPEVKSSLLEEVKRFKSVGGGTIVDNTTTGIQVPGRTQFLKNLSRQTNVHIIAGTGFYVNGSQTESSLALSEEAMAECIRQNIVDGSEDDDSVKSGIIGEVGCSWPITDFERKSIRASASVERELGCPVMAHPGREAEAPEEIVRIFSEAGGNPQRMVMAHLDRTLHTKEELLEFASMGTYLEYDLFGIETSYYQQNEDVSMPSDAQRIERIKFLIEEKHQNRIMISHDIHTKHRLEHFGGHGFIHISTVVLPMMLRRGISAETINQITVQNPAAWLAFI